MLSPSNDAICSWVFVVDASVWVSWLREDDTNHKATERWLTPARLRESEFAAPALLPVEVAAAVARATPGHDDALDASDFIAALVQPNLLPIDSEMINRARHVAAEVRLETGDAFYVATARLLGWDLVTWDKQQRVRGALLTPTYRPDELLG